MVPFFQFLSKRHWALLICVLFSFPFHFKLVRHVKVHCEFIAVICHWFLHEMTKTFFCVGPLGCFLRICFWLKKACCPKKRGLPRNVLPVTRQTIRQSIAIPRSHASSLASSNAYSKQPCIGQTSSGHTNDTKGGSTWEDGVPIRSGTFVTCMPERPRRHQAIGVLPLTVTSRLLVCARHLEQVHDVPCLWLVAVDVTWRGEQKPVRGNPNPVTGLIPFREELIHDMKLARRNTRSLGTLAAWKDETLAVTNVKALCHAYRGFTKLRPAKKWGPRCLPFATWPALHHAATHRFLFETFPFLAILSAFCDALEVQFPAIECPHFTHAFWGMGYTHFVINNHFIQTLPMRKDHNAAMSARYHALCALMDRITSLPLEASLPILQASPLLFRCLTLPARESMFVQNPSLCARTSWLRAAVVNLYEELPQYSTPTLMLMVEFNGALLQFLPITQHTRPLYDAALRGSISSLQYMRHMTKELALHAMDLAENPLDVLDFLPPDTTLFLRRYLKDMAHQRQTLRF